MRSDSFAAYANRQVCVTGGAGFVGSHLCRALLDRAARVRVIDDLSNGRRENIEWLGASAGASGGALDLVEATILDDVALDRAVRGAEVVFHLAAVASVARSVREPALYVEVNAIGTSHVLEAARRAGARRVVYAASSSAYGDAPGLPRRESQAPDPRSPYAAAKLAGEYLVRSAAWCHDLQAVSLRFFNIFGPRQRADSPYAAVIPLLVRSLARGEAPVIYGDGRQTRDFTFVANAVHACMLAGSTARELRGETVNVAAGEERSVLEMLEAVAARLGVPAACTFAPERAGEVRRSVAAIDAARDLLGYEPITSFETGLDQTVAHDAQACTENGGSPRF